MPLILRVDVDKPYGRANVREKILSKLCEYDLLPRIPLLGHLKHLGIFLAFLKEEGLGAHVYFRRCTLPRPDETLLKGHMIGVHAEDTVDLEKCRRECEEIQAHFRGKEITSFTKHGSGVWKSGRRHHPPYEPQKYLAWAKALGIPFLFGNEDMSTPDGSSCGDRFYPCMFWIDALNDGDDEAALQPVLDRARHENVVVLIHPCNFVADKRVERRMRKLVSMARQQNIKWITL